MRRLPPSRARRKFDGDTYENGFTGLAAWLATFTAILATGAYGACRGARRPRSRPPTPAMEAETSPPRSPHPAPRAAIYATSQL